jgi:hypothetical protein
MEGGRGRREEGGGGRKRKSGREGGGQDERTVHKVPLENIVHQILKLLV